MDIVVTLIDLWMTFKIMKNINREWKTVEAENLSTKLQENQDFKVDLKI